MNDSMQPAISYCYGAKLRGRMFAFEKRVLLAGALLSGITLAGMRLGGQGIISLFIRENDPALLEMSLRAMELFSFTYLTGWIGVGLSAFFTAVNRPGTSLGISIGRALFFPLLALAVLVPLLGVDGVWLTSAASSTLTAVTAAVFPRAVFVRTEKRGPDRTPFPVTAAPAAGFRFLSAKTGSFFRARCNPAP